MQDLLFAICVIQFKKEAFAMHITVRPYVATDYDAISRIHDDARQRIFFCEGVRHAPRKTSKTLFTF